ncbi:hypothetical protein CGRA01v4_08660 [Colletotrichum graminicola]|nr:hypothetical protein CGRA01v4_08660 [Colletotrichum graminicola]
MPTEGKAVRISASLVEQFGRDLKRKMHLRIWQMISHFWHVFVSSLGRPQSSLKPGEMRNTRPGDAQFHTSVMFPTSQAALPAMRHLPRSRTRFRGGRETCVFGVG